MRKPVRLGKLYTSDVLAECGGDPERVRPVVPEESPPRDATLPAPRRVDEGVGGRGAEAIWHRPAPVFVLQHGRGVGRAGDGYHDSLPNKGRAAYGKSEKEGRVCAHGWAQGNLHREYLLEIHTLGRHRRNRPSGGRSRAASLEEPPLGRGFLQ
jgi:hypothetical protein